MFIQCNKFVVKIVPALGTFSDLFTDQRKLLVVKFIPRKKLFSICNDGQLKDEIIKEVYLIESVSKAVYRGKSVQTLIANYLIAKPLKLGHYTAINNCLPHIFLGHCNYFCFKIIIKRAFPRTKSFCLFRFEKNQFGCKLLHCSTQPIPLKQR